MSKSLDSRLELGGAVNKETLAEISSYIGKPARIELWGTEASRDNIRRYALGIGDINPLWQDMGHGRCSAFGTIMAPPTFLYSIFDAEIVPGAGGLMSLNAGSHWYFYDRVRLGEQLDASGMLIDVQMEEGPGGAKRFRQKSQSVYYRLDLSGRERTKIAVVERVSVRMPKKGDGEGALTFTPRAPYAYSAEELEAIQRDVMAVQVRGSTPRYWNDVKVGESIGRVVKGPYTKTTMICYYAGAIGSVAYRAHDFWWRNRYLALHNPEALPNVFDSAMFLGTGITSGGHHDPSIAHDMGMPGMYDNGNQRAGVTATVVTNWMGDVGFLEELDVRVRRPVILGDTIWIEGWVEEKLGPADGPWAVGGAPYRQVCIQIEGKNQLGDLVVTGSSIVALPQRL